MAQVLVRQVEDGVVDSLKRKAAARGTSLEGFVRDMMTREAQETRADIVARLRARLAEQPAQTSDSTALLRASRDSAEEMEGDRAA